MPRKPKPTKLPHPPDLTADQVTLWNTLAGEYGFQVPHRNRLVLRSVVDIAKRLGEVRAELDAAGIVTTGSKGQVRDSPLLVREQGLRKELTAHLTQWEQIQRYVDWDVS